MPTPIWVTIPTYNEIDGLEPMLRATADELEQTAPGQWKLLVVDDSSPDGTGELADRLAGEIDELEVLHREGKGGLGQAYLAGFRRAVGEGAELVIVMDADFSHDPRHLPALLDASKDHHLVLGSRYVEGGRIVEWPRLRRMLSHWGSVYARTILGVQIRDLTTGYRCIRREVLQTIEPTTLRSQGYVFNIELTYRALLAGFAVTERPICFRDRMVGVSKMTLGIAVEALFIVPRLRRARRRFESRAVEETAAI